MEKPKRNKKGQYIQRELNEKYDGYSVFYDQKGYKIMYLPGEIYIKQHIYIWEKHNKKKKPKGHEIHHINGIKDDNRIENLICLSNSNHQRIHAGWEGVQTSTGWLWIRKPCNLCNTVFPLSEFYPRKGYTPSALCKKCSCIKTDEWKSKNELKVKQYKHEWYVQHKDEIYKKIKQRKINKRKHNARITV